MSFMIGNIVDEQIHVSLKLYKSIRQYAFRTHASPTMGQDPITLFIFCVLNSSVTNASLLFVTVSFLFAAKLYILANKIFFPYCRMRSIDHI